MNLQGRRHRRSCPPHGRSLAARILGCVLLSLPVCGLHGEDWPEFRGPTGQGHSTERGLPWHWSRTNGVAWSQALPGRGWSSPAVVKGRVYLTTAAEDAEPAGALSLRALCLDAATGRILWNTAVFTPEGAGQIHKKNSHASSSPLVRGSRVYVHFGHHGTACLDRDGRVLWRQTSLRYPPVHGNGGSPVLVGRKLIFSADGASEPFLAALDARDGRVAWKSARQTGAQKKFSFSTPLVIEVNGRKQVISPGSGAVCAFDPDDGRELWRVRYGEGYSVVPRPVSGHGLVFLSSGFDRPAVLAIRPDGRGDVTESHVAWTLNKGAPTTPSLLLAGNELYMVSDGGIATCADARSGEVHWQERLGGGFSASPIHADSRLYFLNEEGTTTVLRASRTFEALATNALGKRALASPAVADGALYLRTEEHLFKITAPKPQARR